MSETIDSAIKRDRRHWLSVAREADGDEGIDWLAAEMKDYYRDVLPGREPDELASRWSHRQYDRGCESADAAVDAYDWWTAAEEFIEAVQSERRETYLRTGVC